MTVFFGDTNRGLYGGVLRVLLAFLLVLGCSTAPAPGTPAEPAVVEGGICGTSLSACVGSDAILKCEGRRWTRRSCKDICGSAERVALGCDFQSDDGHCLCGDQLDARACVDGETQCGAADTVVTCRSGTWVPKSCASACAERDGGYRSAGCRHAAPDACVCTIEGTACKGETPFCASPTELASCERGLMTLTDCGADCQNTLQGRCTAFSGDAGGACTCGP